MIEVIAGDGASDEIDIVEWICALNFDDLGTGETVEVETVEGRGEGGRELCQELSRIGSDEDALDSIHLEGNDGRRKNVLPDKSVASREPS